MDQTQHFWAHFYLINDSLVHQLKKTSVFTFSEQNLVNSQLFDYGILIVNNINPPKELFLKKSVVGVSSIEVFIDKGNGDVEVEVLRIMESSRDEMDYKTKGGILVWCKHDFHSTELDSPANIFADGNFKTS